MQQRRIVFRRWFRARQLPKAPTGWRWIVFDDGRVAYGIWGWSFNFRRRLGLTMLGLWKP